MILLINNFVLLILAVEKSREETHGHVKHKLFVSLELRLEKPLELTSDIRVNELTNHLLNNVFGDFVELVVLL